jgi:hypothetical protein
MWSLISPRAERISGPKKVRSSARRDFFNSTAKSGRSTAFMTVQFYQRRVLPGYAGPSLFDKI